MVASAGIPIVLMAAGASGGHVFPALATAEALRDRGIETVFVLGGGKFNKVVEDAGFTVEQLPARPWADRGLMAKVQTVLTLFKAYLKAQKLVRKYAPVAAFGTGGYATVALVMAAKANKIPTMIHEQNAVPGRANHFLSTFVDKIAASFGAVAPHFGKAADKVVETGNPLRKAALAKATTDFPPEPPFNLMILGGSLGAEFLSTIIPSALGHLSEGKLVKLNITHQARPENVETVQKAYRALGATYEVSSFFDDLPERLAKAHLIISRAGASAITEFALYGRPSILIPHRLADNHQRANAKTMADKNAAILLEQQECTPEQLGKLVADLLDNPQKRQELAANAHKLARPTAAVETAEVLINLAGVDRG
jgi:UDP-N-acetylglucosamine--N-acetylmuramyl-(pentapeptide) pyrophosphoryl-undecaprenol N-acetylglucosamine transferase